MGMLNKKIGGTIIEKDRDDVGGRGGLLQGPDYISKYRNKSISKWKIVIKYGENWKKIGMMVSMAGW